MSSLGATVGNGHTVGIVTDSISGEPLPFVNVFSKKTQKGTLTDESGVFTLKVPSDGIISISSMGYLPKELKAITGDTLRIKMVPESYTLEEVVIKPKKGKYSKKNNPAVDLMKTLRHQRKELDPSLDPFYNYESYTKTVLGFNDFDADLNPDKSFNKRFDFFKTFIDTTLWTGKRVLDLSLKEKYAVNLNTGKPFSKKEVITGYRSVGIDESFNQDNIRAMLEDILREINVYENDINLMQNHFVSPLSAIGPDYYMYHITDTVAVGNQKCIELSFAPHNPESFGFNGKLFIPLDDSVKYVKRVYMRVPKSINLNYVDNIFISQNFYRDSIGKVHKLMDNISLELKLMPGTQPLYATRDTRYRNFSYEPRKDLEKYYSKGGDIFEIDEAQHRNSGFWDANRLVSLSHAESQMGSLITAFRKVPFLYWSEKILNIIVNGYIATGSKSKFDIGPVNTFFGYNTAEGFRMRVGGMTTANLNKHLFARGYVAYGFKDKKIKYNAELEYSFLRKKYHAREFPMNAIRIGYQYDRDELGQHYLFTNSDNVFLAWKRMKSDLITYRRMASFEYNLELRNYLSFGLGYRHETQEATPWVTFRNGFGENYSQFRQGEFFFRVRYAPGEKFVQGASQRLAVNMDAPIITLTHEYGPRKLFGADFTINKTELSVRKRFWFSAFGYANVIVKGGIMWSQVMFPALLWQNANLSYTIQPESFSLLNPMEFAMDRYASWDLEYFGNGILFNRIPLIKKLKLREVFTFKGFCGRLSSKNNPSDHPELFVFPVDANTRPIGKDPYMEIGAGIDNILTILRVDYVWRLTYKNVPGIDRHGLRISLHFSF